MPEGKSSNYSNYSYICLKNNSWAMFKTWKFLKFLFTHPKIVDLSITFLSLVPRQEPGRRSGRGFRGRQRGRRTGANCIEVNWQPPAQVGETPCWLDYLGMLWVGESCDDRIMGGEINDDRILDISFLVFKSLVGWLVQGFFSLPFLYVGDFQEAKNEEFL